MLFHNKFPENRQRDPKRRAEWRVYRSLDETDREGHVIYEVKVARTAPEVDFFIIIQDKVVVCMQVKGGRYNIVGGDWHLETDDGDEYVPDPMKLTWDSAMAIRDHLKQAIGRKIFVLSVLVLPDMQPDPDIDMMAENDRTAVMYGVDDLVERLVDLAETRDVYGTPSPHMAERIVNALMPHAKAGLPEKDSKGAQKGRSGPSQPELPGMTEQTPTVHHADVVNVYNYMCPVTINNYGSEDDGAQKEVVS